MTTPIYIDTSVLAAYYLDETNSEVSQEVIRSTTQVMISELCVVELSSALAGNPELWLLDVDAITLTRYLMPTESGYAESSIVDTTGTIQLPNIGLELDLALLLG